MWGTPFLGAELVLKRASVHFEFSEEVLAAARQLSPLQISPRRNDWSQISTFTIDAAKTKDYDDAFSVVEWSEEKMTLAIHITDLSEWVQPDTPLFEEAEKRLSLCLYPEKNVSDVSGNAFQ